MEWSICWHALATSSFCACSGATDQLMAETGCSLTSPVAASTSADSAPRQVSGQMM